MIAVPRRNVHAAVAYAQTSIISRILLMLHYARNCLGLFLDFLFRIRASSGSVPDPRSARPPKPPKPLSVVRVVSLCRGIQGNTDVFGSDFAQKVRTLCPVHWAETHSFISQGIREDQLTRKEVGFPQRITMLWTGAGKDCRNVCSGNTTHIATYSVGWGPSDRLGES